MLLIDTNVIGAVFDRNNAQHENFRPILDFIIRRRGIMVSGGTRYLGEISRIKNVVALLGELERRGQVRVQSMSAVDDEERRITLLAPPPSCDDQHLIAIISVSRARVIASNDQRADRYLKDRSLYVGGVKRPSIYRRTSHRRLLNRLPTL